VNYYIGRNLRYGIGNRQVNIKPSDSIIPGREYANMTAGKYWYGTPDSTMYSSYFSMVCDTKPSASADLSFHKKYKSSDLPIKSGPIVFPRDQSDFFNVRKKSIAIDFGKENTRDGIVLTVYTQGKELSSTTPGFSIYVQSHRTDIQDNSTFEITKVV